MRATLFTDVPPNFKTLILAALFLALLNSGALLIDSEIEELWGRWLFLSPVPQERQRFL